MSSLVCVLCAKPLAPPPVPGPLGLFDGGGHQHYVAMCGHHYCASCVDENVSGDDDEDSADEARSKGKELGPRVLHVCPICNAPLPRYAFAPSKPAPLSPGSRKACEAVRAFFEPAMGQARARDECEALLLAIASHARSADDIVKELAQREPLRPVPPIEHNTLVRAELVRVLERRARRDALVDKRAHGLLEAKDFVLGLSASEPEPREEEPIKAEETKPTEHKTYAPSRPRAAPVQAALPQPDPNYKRPSEPAPLQKVQLAGGFHPSVALDRALQAAWDALNI